VMCESRGYMKPYSTNLFTGEKEGALKILSVQRAMHPVLIVIPHCVERDLVQLPFLITSKNSQSLVAIHAQIQDIGCIGVLSPRDFASKMAVKDLRTHLLSFSGIAAE
jgi:hypothetical protein